MSNDKKALVKAVSKQSDSIHIKGLKPMPPHTDMYWSYRDGENQQSHLKDYFEILLRRKWIAIVFLIAVVALTAAITFSMQPIYKSTSTIQIKNSESNILTFERDQREIPKEEYYPTQYNILRSKNLAERVIKKLNLDRKVSLQSGVIAKSLLSLKKYVFAFFSIDIQSKAEVDKNIQLINHFIENLEIQPIELSQLVNVSYLSPDPVLSANVSTTVADEYANLMMEIKLKPILEAKKRLQKEADTMRKKLSASEKEFNKYLERSQLIFLNASNAESKSILTLKLTELSSELDKAIADRISKEAIYQEVTKSGVEYGAVLDNPLIQSLTLEYARLEAEYFNLLKIHKPAYPKMIQLEKQIETIKNKIVAEERKILNTLKSDYDIAVKREAFLSAAIESLREDVATFQQKMVHYHILRREVETNRDLYNSLLTRMKEVDISTALSESNVQIIDKAQIPLKPFKPRKALNIILSLFIGLLGGIFLTFFVEYFDHSIKHVEDIENETRVPVVGAVPFIKTDSRKLIGNNGSYQHCHFTEALRSFSTFIQYSNGQKPPKKILITSPLPKDGKSLLATNIAKNLINFSGKGIIIDADMRRARTHEILNVKNTVGLSSYLTGKADLRTVIKNSPHPRFDVITSGPTPTDPSALLNSSRMKELIDMLTRTYNFVIVDSPPVLGISDSLILSQIVDTVVVVVRSSNTPRDALAQTIKLLKGIHANIFGVVLNGISLNSRYGYSRYYTSYYQ